MSRKRLRSLKVDCFADPQGCFADPQGCFADPQGCSADPQGCSADQKQGGCSADPQGCSADQKQGGCSARWRIVYDHVSIKGICDLILAYATEKKQHHVYILESRDRRASYIGYTTKPKRRIRQHNGEIRGGAKYTTLRENGGWRFAAIVSCEDEWFGQSAALSLEWAIKHQRSKSARRAKTRHYTQQISNAATRFLSFPGHQAIERRLNDLFHLLHTRERWTSRAPPFVAGRSLTVQLAPEFLTDDMRARAAAVRHWQPKLAPLDER